MHALVLTRFSPIYRKLVAPPYLSTNIQYPQTDHGGCELSALHESAAGMKGVYCNAEEWSGAWRTADAVGALPPTTAPPPYLARSQCAPAGVAGSCAASHQGESRDDP